MIRKTRHVVWSLCLLLTAAGLASGAGISVGNGLTREFALKPGDKADGHIVVKNTSNTAQTVRVYQVDYSFDADGRTDYGEPGSLARSNCAWMTVAPRQFTVPANSTASAYYTVQVPGDQALAGTYWSVLMVEPVAEDSLEPPKSEQGKAAVGIRTSMRYAVQIVTHIGDTGSKDIEIVRKQVLTNETGASLQLDIRNAGERWVRPSVRVELYSTAGSLVGRFDGGRARIYPDCSVRSCVSFGQLKPGKYTALVLIDDGDQSVWGAQYEMEIR